MKRLHWCNNCKENSVVVEVYTRKSDGKRCRVEYCINKGCGYKQDLPFPGEVQDDKAGNPTGIGQEVAK